MLYSNAVIDWFSVFINLFWILGSAIILAAFSYHFWLAGEEKRPLRIQLNYASFQKAFWTGVLLISVGLAGTSERLWEIVIWTIFALICFYSLFKLLRNQ